MLLHIIGSNPLKDNKCCFPPQMGGNKVLPMEIIYRSLRLHGGGFRKVPIINRTSSRQGRRKRGSQVHPCPVAVEDVYSFL